MIENKIIANMTEYLQSVEEIQRMARAIHPNLYYTDYEPTALDDAINELREVIGLPTVDIKFDKKHVPSIDVYAMRLNEAIRNRSNLAFEMIKKGEDHFFVQRVVDAIWHEFKMLIAAPGYATPEKYLSMLKTVSINGSLLMQIHHNRYDIDRFAKAVQRLGAIKRKIEALENAGVIREKYGAIDFIDSLNGVSISAFEAYCEVLDTVQITLTVYGDRNQHWFGVLTQC